MLWLLLVVPLCYCAPRITPKCEDDLKNVGNTEGYNVASDLLTKAMNFSVSSLLHHSQLRARDFIYRLTLARTFLSSPAVIG